MGEVQSKLGDSNAVTGLSYLEDGQFAKIYKVLMHIYAKVTVCQYIHDSQISAKETSCQNLQQTLFSDKKIYSVPGFHLFAKETVLRN